MMNCVNNNITAAEACEALLRHLSLIQDPDSDFSQAIATIHDRFNNHPSLFLTDVKTLAHEKVSDSKEANDLPGHLLYLNLGSISQDNIAEPDEDNPIDIEGLRERLRMSDEANAEKYARVLSQAEMHVERLFSKGEILEEQRTELRKVVKKSKKDMALLEAVSVHLNTKEYKQNRLICKSFSKVDRNLLDKLNVLIQNPVDYNVVSATAATYIATIKLRLNLSAYFDSFETIINTVIEAFGPTSEMTARTLIDNHLVGCTLLANTIHTVLPELWISRGTECAIPIMNQERTTTVILTGRIDYAIITTTPYKESTRYDKTVPTDMWRKKMEKNQGLRHLVSIMTEIKNSNPASARLTRSQDVEWDIFFIEAKRSNELVNGEDKEVNLDNHLQQVAAQMLAAHIAAFSGHKFLKFCLTNGKKWFLGVFDCENRVLEFLSHDLVTEKIQKDLPSPTLLLLYMWMTLPAEKLRSMFRLDRNNKLHRVK